MQYVFVICVHMCVSECVQYVFVICVHMCVSRKPSYVRVHTSLTPYTRVTIK